MMLAAVHAVAQSDAIGAAGRHETHIAAQATADEPVHAVSPR